MFIMVAVETDN